jgi:hypothetical protein
MTIKIPNESQLTLGQYVAMLSPATDAEKIAKVFDIELEVVQSWKQSAIRTIMEELKPSFEDCKPKFQRFVELNFTDFGFIPNLDGITGAEYADLMRALEQVNVNPLDVAAVLYRPITDRIGKWYRIEDYTYLDRTKHQEQLEKMPLEVYFGAIAFFFDIRNNLRGTTLDYLSSLTAEMSQELNNISQS